MSKQTIQAVRARYEELKATTTVKLPAMTEVTMYKGTRVTASMLRIIANLEAAAK